MASTPSTLINMTTTTTTDVITYDSSHIGEVILSVLQEAHLYIVIAGISISLFGMGCVVSIKDFDDRDTHLSKSVVIGLAFQSLIQPVIGYGLALLLDMNVNEALAMIMLACSPVSPLSVVLVYYAEGVVIVGLCLAMFSTALSMGLIPLWFSIYSSTWTEEFYVIAKPIYVVLIEVVIVVPTLLGVLYKKRFGKVKGRFMARICSNAFWLATITTPIINGITHPEFFRVHWPIWVGAMSIPAIGFVCGLVFALFASLPFNVCCAISLAVGIPNVTLASYLAEIYLGNANKPETLLEIHGLLTIFELCMPIEGFIWAIMYRTIEGFFLKMSEKCTCCQVDDGNDDDQVKKLVVVMDDEP